MAAALGYQDSGLAGSTRYSYRVRAVDAASNTSPYSAVASATTFEPPDTQPPSAPSSASAVATSSTQINVTWAASTDNKGVAGYLLERCQGVRSSFSPVATVTAGTSYSDSGLGASTTYGYRVKAFDAANNASGYSPTAYATTQQAPDTSSPSIPTGLLVTASSDKEIRLGWTAATDNVGVALYLVERCQGATCTNFAQIGAPATTSYNDAGLSAETTYRYRVSARDGSGNTSDYSTILTTTTAPKSPTCQ
jgi:chitodextrinase